MSYKPDPQILMAYLYGELEGEHKLQLEAYLENHPEARKELNDLASAREIIGVIPDKEVIAPPILMEDRAPLKPLWQSTAFRVVTGIAASFLVLMVAARIIGMEISYSNDELRVGFGQAPQSANVQNASMTPQAVQELINASLTRNNETIASEWANNQKKLDEAISQRLQASSRKTDDLLKTASLASQEQVRSFVGGLQDQNLRLMKDYLQLSSAEQKKYVENLLVDFSKYLQEQRSQDLKLFQTRMSSMEQNTNQFKQETEEILSSIISNSGSSPSVTKKQNSY